MKKLFSFLITSGLCTLLFAQGSKSKLASFDEFSEISGEEAESVKPGQLNKSGTWYYYSLEDEEDELGKLCRVKVSGTGEFTGEPEFLDIEDEFSDLDMSKPTLSGGDKIIVFSSADGSWTSNELYIGDLTAGGDVKNIRLLEEVNTEDDADAYPWISADGLHLYWCREGAIMYSHRAKTSNEFDEASEIEVAESIDESFDPVSVWLTASMKEMYFVSKAKIYKATRKNLKSDFGDAKLISEEFDAFISGASFNEAKSRLYLYYSDDESVIKAYNVSW